MAWCRQRNPIRPTNLGQIQTVKFVNPQDFAAGKTFSARPMRRDLRRSARRLWKDGKISRVSGSLERDPRGRVGRFKRLQLQSQAIQQIANILEFPAALPSVARRSRLPAPSPAAGCRRSRASTFPTTARDDNALSTPDVRVRGSPTRSHWLTSSQVAPQNQAVAMHSAHSAFASSGRDQTQRTE
jgi:hypothetical protein